MGTPASQVWLMAAIGVFTCAIVLPAWLWYIMPMIQDQGYVLGVTINGVKNRFKIEDDGVEASKEHLEHCRDLIKEVLEKAENHKIMSRREAKEFLQTLDGYTPPVLAP